MKRAALLLLAVSCAVGGLVLTRIALLDALEARRQLVGELSVTLGRARTLDAIAQQIRNEAGAARPSAEMLREALKGMSSGAARTELEVALSCLEKTGCSDSTSAMKALDAAQREDVASISSLWVLVDLAEGRLSWSLGVGLGLVLLGLIMAAFAPKWPGPVERLFGDSSDGTQGLETMLRERLEALYRTRTELGDSARFGAFGELAAALTHGLKTPLAGVLASVQLAQLKLGQAHVAREELQEVIRLTEGLTEQLQRFLRAAGKVGPQRQRIKVGEVIGGLAAEYSREAERKGVQFSCSVPTPEMEVDVDASLLDMALRNLVENALAAVSRGQVVSVFARPCSAPARVGLEGLPPPSGAAFVGFVVEDEGPGLPAHAQRLEAAVTTRAAGSGLGLSIARRVAERHQGALVLGNRVGGGARVELVLPFVCEEGP